MGSGIAVAALVDHEGATQMSDIDLVGTEQIYKVDLAPLGPLGDTANIAPALLWNEAQVERGHTRGRRVQNVKSVPAAFGRRSRWTDHAGIARDLRGKREDRGAIGPRDRAGPQNEHWALGFLQHARERMRARRESRQNVRRCTQLLDRIRQVVRLTDIDNPHSAREPRL